MMKNSVKDFLYEKESYEIRGAAFEVWKTFRGIFKEKVIDRSFKKELESRGLKVEDQKKLNIYYRGEKVGIYVPDFVVNDKILIEIKVKPFLTKGDERQFWYYLRGSDYKLGFLINFGSEKLEIRRRIYDKAREKYNVISVNQRTHQRISASNNAFTLIELLLTTAIVAVLGTVGLVYILNYKQRQNLSSDTQEIVTIIRNAQDRSISQESASRWGIHFENPTSGTDFYALFKGLTYATSAIVSQNILSSSVQFDTPTSSSSSTVIFYPITGLPDNSLTVKISLVGNPTVSSTIIINGNGKIQY